MTTNNTIPTGFALNQNSSIYDGDTIVTGFNDWYLDSGGNIATIGGVNALMQNVKNALWLWIGEYEFDTNLGLSYPGVFDGDNAGIFTSQIESNILNCNNYLTTDQFNQYGIKEVNSINFVADTITRNVVIRVILLLNNGTTQTINMEQN